MRIEYDRSANAATIDLIDWQPGDSVHQVIVPRNEVVDSIIVLDFDKNSRLISIEITSASQVLPEQVLAEAGIIG